MTTTAPRVIFVAEIADELKLVRLDYLSRFVTQEINKRHGDVISEQIDQWEQQAHDRFAARYPAIHRSIFEEGK